MSKRKTVIDVEIERVEREIEMLLALRRRLESMRPAAKKAAPAAPKPVARVVPAGATPA